MRNFLLNISRMLAINSQSLLETSDKVHQILSTIVGPCLSVIGSIGVIYIVIMGVQYAKAETDDKRAELKKRMVNLAIGVVIMIVMITLCFAIKWNEIIPDLFGYIEPEAQ